MAMLKGFDDPNLQVLQMLNTSKALQVIIAIFLSVAVAFFFGSVVQWITRVLFSFNYKKTLPYLAGIFGGIALTSIVYFMLIKGLQESTFAYKDWINEHTSELVIGCLIGLSILMQVLHWCGVNILKIIVLSGTLALSLAFAGNDLVNFIGVPLAGLSAYQDYMAHGNGAYDTYLMAANNLPAKTPYIFLLGSGIIMTLALFFSKSAQNVIKTSVNLSRQDDGEETFGSSRIARGLVRTSSAISTFLERAVPQKARTWIDSRFNKQELTMEPGAAFDPPRAPAPPFAVFKPESVKQIAHFVPERFFARGLAAVEAGGDFFKLFQQLFLAVGQVDRRFHQNVAVQIARRAGAQGFDAFTFDAHTAAGLRFFRDAQFDFAVQGRDFDFATQGCDGETDRQLAMQIQAVALEDFVFFDADVDVQIACGRAVRTRFAFAAQADALTVVDAGGNVDFNGFAGFGAAFATTFDARVFDFLACAVTGRTSLLHLENGLADVYRAGAVTGRTS